MGKLTEKQEWFIRWERVARLATVDADGQPYVVPICPALDGDDIILSTWETTKVKNLRANPKCAIVFDVYTEDWRQLRQVQVLGTAELITEGPAWDRAKQILDEKYPQYDPVAEIVPGQSIIIRIPPEKVIAVDLD